MLVTFSIDKIMYSILSQIISYGLPQKGPVFKHFLAGIFGNGLGTLANGVLGQFSGKEQPYGGLDFPGSDSGPLVIVGKARGFTGNSFENIVNERIHDGHGL